MKCRQRGFTLVELMIVVAIIGVLAAVAIPKFADMLEKSREGATKGNLGSIKSAVANYYADQQGTYPTNLDTNTYISASAPMGYFPAFLPKYIDQLSPVKCTGKNSSNVNNNSGPGAGLTAGSLTTGTWGGPAFANTSTGKGWKYNAADGAFWVNSTMIDMGLNSYTTYGY